MPFCEKNFLTHICVYVCCCYSWCNRHGLWLCEYNIRWINLVCRKDETQKCYCNNTTTKSTLEMLLRQNKYNIASERMCVMAKRREHKLKMTWFRYGVIDVDVCVCVWPHWLCCCHRRYESSLFVNFNMQEASLIEFISINKHTHPAEINRFDFICALWKFKCNFCSIFSFANSNFITSAILLSFVILLVVWRRAFSDRRLNTHLSHWCFPHTSVYVFTSNILPNKMKNHLFSFYNFMTNS